MEPLRFTNYESSRSLDELPEKYRRIFSSYPCFNSIQSQVLDQVLYSKNSLVLSAPTGSGKTVAFELAIVKLLMDFENIDFQNDFKMVYISPVKALCRERFEDWNPRFAHLGIQTVEITGDGGDYFDLQSYHLIITTPEKWDSMTRKWKDNASLVRLIKLFMIDETHILNDNKRGPVLEAIVCRMKTVAETLKIEEVRFVAVSATIYNIEDLALWLGTKDLPAHFHKFGNESRPVPLQKIVKGYVSPPRDKAFFFDIQLSYKLKSLILEYSKGKPTLIFCSTRKSVFQTSKILSEHLTFHFTEAQKNILLRSTKDVLDHKLKELVLCGIGYHHAGLAAEDRRTIQDIFVNGNLPILVATSTLSMGVNLPAHLVIIKSTQQFIAGKVEEYSESAMLQMIGRAGRPQFDTEATAIIMTKTELVPKYQRLLESKETLESSLHLHLPEHLNSEIVLYTITDLGVAMDWIRHTFLYVRAMKNPKYYGFEASSNEQKIEKNLEAICLKEINGLKRAGLIEVSSNGLDISPTANGRLMSHFYLSFDTFKIFLQIKGTETVPEILDALSEAREFAEVQLRVNERKTLNQLNQKNMLRFPIQGKIKNKAMKVNCLIQSCLGCLPIQDPALHQESIRIVKIAERLVKCLSEYLSQNSDYQSILMTTVLAKCLHARLWEDSPFVSRQLERIGPTLGSLLASCGKTSFSAIEESNPRDLERILNRAPPFGNHLQDAVRHLPKYELKTETFIVDSASYKANITVLLVNGDVLREQKTAGDHHGLSLIVGDTNNSLLNHTFVTDQMLLQRDFTLSLFQKCAILPFKMVIHLISNQWAGIDIKREVIIWPQSCNYSGLRIDPAATVVPTKKKIPKQCNASAKAFNFFSQYFTKATDSKTLKENETFFSADVESKVIKRFGQPVERPVKDNSKQFKCCFDIDICIESEDKVAESSNISLNNFNLNVNQSLPEESHVEKTTSVNLNQKRPYSYSDEKEKLSDSSYSLMNLYNSLKKVKSSGVSSVQEY